MTEQLNEKDECIERACEVMHDAYERAAVGAGWETQERSRKQWSDVPEANKVTMRAAVGALIDWLRAERIKRAPSTTVGTADPMLSVGADRAVEVPIICCPGAGTMAHVRSCRHHPEAGR